MLATPCVTLNDAWPPARARRVIPLAVLLAAMLGFALPLTGQRVLGTAVSEQPRNAQGDFTTGDAVRITIVEEPELSGEFQVGPDLTLDMKRLGTLSLAGMSRAQATAAIEQRVRRVVRAPGNITVQPLIRLAVLGAVGGPGFHQYPVSTTLPDALTVAGGPRGDADLDRVTIQRGDERLIERDKVSQAITQSRTLDQLGLRSGDRIIVGQRVQRNWGRTIRDVAYGVTAVITLVTLGTRIF